MSASERKRGAPVGRWVITAALLVCGIIAAIPVYWTVIASLQPEVDGFGRPPQWIPRTITFEHFADALDLIPFFQQFANSVLVTGTVVVLSLLVALLAAYALARLDFAGRPVVFAVFLTALMIPGQVTVIPIYIMLRNAGLTDNLLGLILPATVQVVAIFLLRQHLLSMPAELSDAASIDGAGSVRILFQILLPGVTPALSALAIFIAQSMWNDFFWPNLIMSTPERLTLPVGIYQLGAGAVGAPPPVIFAAITLIVLPLLVLFLFAQRRLTEGIAFVGTDR